jgi:AAA+ ATPase superfamily predicted ATPase
VRLPFLDREPELARLSAALARPSVTLVTVYGRRRLGKSRLVQRILDPTKDVYYVGDARDAAVQRAALAREIGRVVPSFDAVAYPGWDELLERFWHEAAAGAVLALDELPALVASSPELPSLLQKWIDRGRKRRLGVVLSGSSQRMMHGLCLDGSAPLYGRAAEILRLPALAPAWLKRALRLRRDADVVEAYAVWGGVPRYWELAADHEDLFDAVTTLLLDPMGVLHNEPERLLADDVREVARAHSILALVGQGCHRLSEIGARLGVPATSLSRPVGRLLDCGHLRREVPFGRSLRDTKRTLYRLGEPLLAFWYRFVEPNRSRLAALQIPAVRRDITQAWPAFLGDAWETLARDSAPKIEIAGRTWGPASRWWGTTRTGRKVELDIVAADADDPSRVLVGEAKLTCTRGEAAAALSRIEAIATECPELTGMRVVPSLWVLRPWAGFEGERDPSVVTARDVARLRA